jgi:hypothetical protein
VCQITADTDDTRRSNWRWNWPVMLAGDADLAGLKKIGVGERTAARWDLNPSGPMAAKSAAPAPADAEAIAP